MSIQSLLFCFFLSKVEVWLNRVLDSMRSTVRHEMTEAVMAYEDKPREQWLFDYPAQVNRLGVCIDLTDAARFIQHQLDHHRNRVQASH